MNNYYETTQDVFVGEDKDNVACRIIIITNNMFYEKEEADKMLDKVALDAGNLLRDKMNKQVEH